MWGLWPVLASSFLDGLHTTPCPICLYIALLVAVVLSNTESPSSSWSLPDCTAFSAPHHWLFSYSVLLVPYCTGGCTLLSRTSCHLRRADFPAQCKGYWYHLSQCVGVHIFYSLSLHLQVTGQWELLTSQHKGGCVGGGWSQGRNVLILGALEWLSPSLCQSSGRRSCVVAIAILSATPQRHKEIKKKKEKHRG